MPTDRSGRRPSTLPSGWSCCGPGGRPGRARDRLSEGLLPRATSLLRLTDLRRTMLRARRLRLPPNLPLTTTTLPGLLLPTPHRTRLLLPRLLPGLLLPGLRLSGLRVSRLLLSMPAMNRLPLAWQRLPGPRRTWLSLTWLPVAWLPLTGLPVAWLWLAGLCLRLA